ncbi:MAG: winged helix-turn-helix transcriptional regulator, partial [Chloroflexi bacterium]|nr:winged helix-turn-helix transcriptional regulator [Chloroflexota bacterium]
MQSTRWEILQLLQRRGKITVRELSTELRLTSTGVRQHLTLLQRDSLVSCAEERGAVGRPHYLFSLTEAGQALFPRNYDLLADWLLDELRESEGEEKLTLLLRKMGAKLAEPHMVRVEGKPQAERVQEVLKLLQSMGVMAEA